MKYATTVGNAFALMPCGTCPNVMQHSTALHRIPAAACFHFFLIFCAREQRVARHTMPFFSLLVQCFFNGLAPATLPIACSRGFVPHACCPCTDSNTMTNLYFDDDDELREMLGENASPSWVSNMVKGLEAQEEAKFLTAAIFVPSLDYLTIPGLEDTEVQIANCTAVVRAPQAWHTSACRQNQRRWAWRRSTVLPHETWHPWQHLAQLVLVWSALRCSAMCEWFSVRFKPRVLYVTLQQAPLSTQQMPARATIWLSALD